MKKIVVSISLAALLLVACSKEQEKKDEDITLKPTSFEVLDAWRDDDVLGAYNAYLKSCDKIAQRDDEFLNDNAAIKIKRRDYLAVCAKARDVIPAKFKKFVEDNFVPMAVEYQGETEGRFTSYYEAEIRGSYARDATYKYPIYGRPYDLVEANLRDFDASLPSKQIVGRVVDGRLIPYFDRAEITQNGVNAPVVMWADDEIDVYIMQIQGSAVAIQPDGSKVRIAYAANNGKPFKGIGSILLGKGLLSPSQASMGSIKQWLRDNPGLAAANMNENQRYIFHKLGNQEGPVGAFGVPLTAGRSMAVDTDYIPLGSLLWVETSAYDGTPLNRLVIAQDVGSAIKGAVRGDYFYGSGGDEILEKAGKMNSKGHYFVLMPKAEDSEDDKES